MGREGNERRVESWWLEYTKFLVTGPLSSPHHHPSKQSSSKPQVLSTSLGWSKTSSKHHAFFILFFAKKIWIIKTYGSILKEITGTIYLLYKKSSLRCSTTLYTNFFFWFINQRRETGIIYVLFGLYLLDIFFYQTVCFIMTIAITVYIYIITRKIR